jgi:G:T/U-mismatch repair DNA glycosylase
MKVAESTTKKRAPKGLPILGLLLAIALLAFSYGVSFPLVKLAEDHSTKVHNAFDDLRQKFEGYSWYRNNEQYHGNHIVEIIATLVLWFVTMGSAMLLVSALLIGTDPEREAWKEMSTSPANKKAMLKQLKKDLKEAKKRERMMKR